MLLNVRQILGFWASLEAVLKYSEAKKYSGKPVTNNRGFFSLV
jgi:hypothetical protein